MPRSPRRFRIKRHPLFHVCTKCGGEGLVDARLAALTDDAVLGRTCPKCDGHGEVPAPPMRAPWVLRDAARPAFLGQYTTHALALAAVNAKLREEAGRPIVDISVAEVREAMTTRRAAREAAARA